MLVLCFDPSVSSLLHMFLVVYLLFSFGRMETSIRSSSTLSVHRVVSGTNTLFGAAVNILCLNTISCHVTTQLCAMMHL